MDGFFFFCLVLLATFHVDAIYFLGARVQIQKWKTGHLITRLATFSYSIIDTHTHIDSMLSLWLYNKNLLSFNLDEERV